MKGRNIFDTFFIVVDLFCGAGGTTSGFENREDCVVIACVNHDANAIKSHAANHPNCKHFTEDIRHMNLAELRKIVDNNRKIFPYAKLILWASLECTNFSKAKGGQPRDADSRTLADHMPKYIIALDPEYFMVENVVEFMSWGPLDDKGKPLSRRNGTDFMRWCNEINDIGGRNSYRNEWRELNAADYGAYTSRNRLFGIFAKDHLPIAWPKPTHQKSRKPRVALSLFDTVAGYDEPRLKQWKAVKEILNLQDEGVSIFDRKKPLSDKTLERIYAGLIKFVAGGKDKFMLKYNSVSASKPEGKNISTDGPAGTVTCVDGQALVNASFIVQRNNGNPESKVVDIDGPARTLTATAGNQDVAFIQKWHGNGDNLHSLDNPCPTIATKDQCGIVTPQFIYRDLTRVSNSSIDSPAGSLTTVPKMSIVSASPFIMPTNFDNGPSSVDEPLGTVTANRKWHYLVNPAWGGNGGSVEEPCCTVVARQDKAPLYLVEATPTGYDIAIRVDDIDTAIMTKIKEFMVIYGITDIKMRMLKIPELLQIQGFPKDYILYGSQAEQKKYIGNSVHKLMPDVIAGAIIHKLKGVEV